MLKVLINVILILIVSPNGEVEIISYDDVPDGEGAIYCLSCRGNERSLFECEQQTQKFSHARDLGVHCHGDVVRNINGKVFAKMFGHEQELTRHTILSVSIIYVKLKEFKLICSFFNLPFPPCRIEGTWNYM